MRPGRRQCTFDNEDPRVKSSYVVFRVRSGWWQDRHSRINLRLLARADVRTVFPCWDVSTLAWLVRLLGRGMLLVYV
jgi:hypothetical protein